jgi:hypothetical protein
MSRSLAAAVVGLMVGGLWCGVAAAADVEGERRTPPRDGAVVVAWNAVAHDVGFATDRFMTFRAQHAMAMMHLAMHDAVAAIDGRYEAYAWQQRDPLADPLTAASQAAHDVLLAAYPETNARLAAELAGWLGRAGTGEAAERGRALGARAAAALLAARSGDGWDVAGSYAFTRAAGRYQTTPPWDSFVLQPGFRRARPFGLRAADQLRPPPPPPLGSPEYAAAYAEVVRVGGADSAQRSPEQTSYAIWWMEFAEGSVNRLARELALERQMELADAARLFALLDMGLYDAYVATWDAKYEFDHWRPYTAIRAADADDNPATAADGDWEPLRPTPPFPEYVSAHAAGCGVTFDLLRRAFGDTVGFAMSTTTAPPEMAVRRFASFAAAAEECADSRVRLGWHFRYATDAGLALGRAVAAQLSESQLRPRPRS